MHGFAEADELEVVGGDGEALFAGNMGKTLVDAEHDVIQGGEPGEEGGGLEDDAAVGAGAGEFPIAEDHVAAAFFGEAGDHGEHGGFAAAGVADEGDRIPLRPGRGRNP